MSLNNEERLAMISLELEKADRFMVQAEMATRWKQWDMAANRFYYACFHAVRQKQEDVSPHGRVHPSISLS